MFGALGTLLGRAANIVHNDVIAPIQRDVGQPIHNVAQAAVAHVERPVVKAWQTVNPNSGYNQAKPVVRQAQNQYQFTPQFSAIVNGGNPSYTNNFAQNGLLQKGAAAAAEFLHSNPVNQIQLQKGNSDPNVLVHEALHRQWQINPNDHSNFTNAYMKGANMPLRGYLAHRLASYKEFQQGPTTELMNINQATPEIQNEMHSYIPEYYATTHQAMPAALSTYYSQFFNPSAAFAQNNAPAPLFPMNSPALAKIVPPTRSN